MGGGHIPIGLIDDLPGVTPCWHSDPIVDAEVAELSRLAVRKAMRKFRGRDRKVIRMSFLDGLKNKEIAEFFGRSEAWASYELKRILKRVKNETTFD